MVDGTAEIEALGDSSRSRRELAEKAANVIEDKIANSDYFSPEEAVRLAGDLVAYMAEARLHSTDQRRDDLEQGKFDANPDAKAIKLQKANHMHSRRMELEAILVDARQGNFSKLKQYIRSRGDESGMANQKKSKKMHKLAGAIPDQGDPYKLPTPAWQLDKE